ncbi:CPP1 [Scenedesmus sp. PABB004]|nr:CPP1 [Scenedesmus sp. PABB004]
MNAAGLRQQAGGLLRRPAPGACAPRLPGLAAAPRGAGSGRWARLQTPRSAADAGALGGDVPQQPPPAEEEQPYEYKPFARLRERNPYRLLGVSREASFEEIQDARNYLYEQYKWHEPSREAIELAFDSLLQKHLSGRFKFGFRPPRTGRRTDVIGERRSGLLDAAVALLDPTVTTRTLINEGAVFGAFALWVLFSSDQSFPLAGAFAYSVYQFQSKRVRRDPEGPFLGGNAIVGAILSTLACLAVACAVMAVLTGPLTAVLGQSSRQVGGFITIAVMGAVGIYLK